MIDRNLIDQGETVQLAATAHDANGNAISGKTCTRPLLAIRI